MDPWARIARSGRIECKPWRDREPAAGQREHGAFHRVFSTAPWDPDDVGRRLFRSPLRWLPQIERFARRGRRPGSGEQLRFSFAA